MKTIATPRHTPRRFNQADQGGASETRRRRRHFGAFALALLAPLLLPGLAAAHPLGNFTINHYAGLRIEIDRILLDVVIDQAEIPTFQARLNFDIDSDGELSEAEQDTARVAACGDLAAAIDLRVDDAPQELTLVRAGLAFPTGAGGLSTMRLVCGFTAALAGPIIGPVRIDFADRSFRERLGWREIVVGGSGVRIEAADGHLRATSLSERLTTYPTDLLTQALADTEIAVVATPGGPVLPPPEIPDSAALPGAGAEGVSAVSGREVGSVGSRTSATAAGVGAVPGGVGIGELPAIFSTADLTPVVLLISVLTAAGLGAGHALTPGHGKTLMAAYLVGTRGTPIHAAGLGLSVALSHTLGILLLAGLVVGAQGVLPPEVVIRTAPVVAAISIFAIGAWMLVGEGRRRWRLRALAVAHDRAHASGSTHDHPDEHGHGHEHGQLAVQPHGGPDGHHDQHDRATHGDEAAHAHQGEQQRDVVHEHSHGGARHSHLPPAGSTISWRSLFGLGLAGGLIPSASALLILLGSVAAGRAAIGFVLVIAFGLGMALVMGGIGLALVVARSRLDRVGGSTWLGRASGSLPLVASVLVLGFGIYLTFQAVFGNATL